MQSRERRIHQLCFRRGLPTPVQYKYRTERLASLPLPGLVKAVKVARLISTRRRKCPAVQPAPPSHRGHVGPVRTHCTSQNLHRKLTATHTLSLSLCLFPFSAANGLSLTDGVTGDRAGFHSLLLEESRIPRVTGLACFCRCGKRGLGNGDTHKVRPCRRIEGYTDEFNASLPSRVAASRSSPRPRPNKYPARQRRRQHGCAR